MFICIDEFTTNSSDDFVELTTKDKIKHTGWIAVKISALVALLYFFICSLDLLSTAFRLLGSRAVGRFFSDNQLLHNPVVGLMIGVLVTVLVQSSSTSTSIVVTMVASHSKPPTFNVQSILIIFFFLVFSHRSSPGDSDRDGRQYWHLGDQYHSVVDAIGRSK